MAVNEECTEKGHDPDIWGVKVTFEKDAVYVDVNCKRCGRGGCVAMWDEGQHLPEVNWD